MRGYTIRYYQGIFLILYFLKVCIAYLTCIKKFLKHVDCFAISDDCHNKPCVGANTCMLQDDKCKCNEGREFDDEDNCVGKLTTYLNLVLR